MVQNKKEACTPHTAHRTPHTAHRRTPHVAKWQNVQTYPTSCIRAVHRCIHSRVRRLCTTRTQSTYFTFLPPQAIRELQKLCDAVAPYPTEDAIRMVELELGSKVSELFDGLDGSTTPIAAASLGQ